MDSLFEKAIETGNLSREEIISLLSLDEKESIARLLAVADQVRKEECGDDVHIRGLIEFSNICIRNCLYCGLRRENNKVRRYRMSIDEVVEAAVKVGKYGVGTVVLQSGEDPWFTAERMAEIIQKIKSKVVCAVTLCIGERSSEDYRIMREAGADRFLLRHETANPELYRRLHPDMSFVNRLCCLNNLREHGYQVGAGNIVGLPGQSVADLADDALFVKELDADMVGIGPFIPHPNTPLANYPSGSLDMSLKMVAVVRIVTRNALIPATTAVGTVDPFGREKALMAGANVVMPNFTPLEYRVHYEIYPAKKCITEDPQHSLADIRARIESIGRRVATGPGHSPKKRL
ncbi:MAG: [FeFe] hydrogenase H-cluster radical SAM maturase HydE [Armatimonadetes bacterium]|nr:[FeFe] hydrogenase H-cluster radical SAM maturase HydE [Armatimonadota bacterium]